MAQHEKHELNVSDDSQAVNVPVFNCIVYISSDADSVKARVANLPDLEVTASSEREALAQLVPAFKQRVSDLMQSETPIPWIDPPIPAEPGELQRFIPVHL